MPFLTPLCGLILGILMANQFHQIMWGLIPIAAGAALYLYLLRQMADPLKAIRINPLHNLWVFLIFSGIGFIACSLQRPATLSDREIARLHMAQGVVVRTESRANGDRILAKVTHLTDSLGALHEINSMTVLIATPGFSTDPGDIIIFPARLQEITDNPNYRPNGYPERMKRQGILYRVALKEGEIKIVGNHASLSSKAWELRNNLIAKIEKSSLSRETVNFTVALIFGDRSFISEETRQNFSNIGVSHILALSGLHVGILMIIIGFLLYPLRFLGWHRIALYISVLIIWGFAVLTGLSPSTVRSCLMLTLGLIAFTLQRQAPAINSLVAATFIILLLSPASLYDVGLQLSVVCVASILVFAEALNPVDHHHHPRIHSLVNAVAVSMAATLSSWVVVSYYFGTVPLLFIPANFILLPVLPLFMALALSYIILITLGIDLSWLAYCLDSIYAMFQHAAQLLHFAGETAVEYQTGLQVALCWLAGVIAVGYGIKREKKAKQWAYTAGGVLFGLSIVLIFTTGKEDRDELIVQNNFRQISVVIYEKGRQYELELPLRSIGRIQRGEIELVSIDCLADSAALKEAMEKGSDITTRHLIISGGSYGLTLGEIPGIREFDKIILHSSIRRKMEAQLIKEAEEMGLTNIHSLREDGPLKLSFEDEEPLAKR